MAHTDLTDRLDELHALAEGATDSADALNHALAAYERAVRLDQRVSLSASLREGDLTPADYHEFLRTGATADSVTMLSQLGADPREPSTYERATEVFGRYLDD